MQNFTFLETKTARTRRCQNTRRRIVLSAARCFDNTSVQGRRARRTSFLPGLGLWPKSNKRRQT